ncbi:MAG: redox-regulated ATPase YchF, partial [Pyrinomonadaceae bacterium]|nr:redox-regulated ATPase YchF [Pyrinomonadaceae bacterium]
IVQVVRCFEDENIVHVEGSVNPIRDIETIAIELILSDMATLEKRRDRQQKAARSGNKDAKAENDVIDKLMPALEDGKAARTVDLNDEEKLIAKGLFLLTTKPTIFAANVDEDSLSNPDENPHVKAVKDFAASENAETVVICAKLEADLYELAPEERAEFLKDVGVDSSGVDNLIKSAYHLLGLMSFLTAGEKEVRAWTIPIGTKAPKAASEIHSDIERGFIRAEIVSYPDLIRVGSNNAAREQGLLRSEGKEYVMQEGDIVNFRFNV